MNRRNKNQITQNMVWNKKHKMWLDVDDRTKAQKKSDEKVVSSVKKIRNKKNLADG